MYGSLYSSEPIVMHYLLRLHPSYILRITESSPLFLNIQGSWESSLGDISDLKELTPEFYHGHGDFLINSTVLNMGVDSIGQKVTDVNLPKWASSPSNFIYQMRRNLECEEISA
jgi:hypothetical protein